MLGVTSFWAVANLSWFACYAVRGASTAATTIATKPQTVRRNSRLWDASSKAAFHVTPPVFVDGKVSTVLNASKASGDCDSRFYILTFQQYMVPQPVGMIYSCTTWYHAHLYVDLVNVLHMLSYAVLFSAGTSTCLVGNIDRGILRFVNRQRNTAICENASVCHLRSSALTHSRWGRGLGPFGLEP